VVKERHTRVPQKGAVIVTGESQTLEELTSKREPLKRLGKKKKSKSERGVEGHVVRNEREKNCVATKESEDWGMGSQIGG